MSIDRAKVLDSAQKLLAKGLLDKAIAEYRKLVDDDPKDPRTWLKIGDIYARKGDVRGACNVYHQVADQYASQGFFLKAVAVYKQILKVDLDQPEALRQLAEMYEMLSLISDAFVTYEQLLDREERMGDSDKVLATLEKMVQLDPRNVPVTIRYAEALSKENRKDEAARAFADGARILKEQGNKEDFIKVAERLLFHRPDDIDLARELAELYMERDDSKRALVKLQICFKADPANIRTLEMIAEGFKRLGQTPKTVSVYKEIARLHAEAEQHEQRAGILRKILELDPNNHDAKSELAQIESKLSTRISEDQLSEKPRTSAPEEPAVLEEEGEISKEINDASDERPRFSILENLSDGKATSEQPEDGDEVFFVESDKEEETDIPVSGVEEIPVTFSSFAPPPSTGSSKSASTAPPSSIPPPSPDAQIKRLMSECEVFLRYSLNDKAFSLLNKVLDIDPHYIEARRILKDLYIDTGNLSEATNQLFLLAASVEEKDQSAAADYLLEIIEIDPTNDRARTELEAIPILRKGSTREETKSSSAPVILLEASTKDVATEPPNPRLDLDTEEATSVKGAFSKPAEPTEEGSDSLSEELVEIFEEIDFYLDQNLIQAARATIKDALESFPDHPALLEKLRHIESISETAASAKKKQQEEKTRDGESQLDDTHYTSGVAYMEMELHDLAIREFELCLTNERLSCKAYTMLGLCHLSRGEIHEGIENFEAGLLTSNRTDQEEMVIHFELGNAYELLEDYEQAQKNFQKVASKNPNFRDVKERIQRSSDPPKETDAIENFDQLFDDIIIKE